MNAPKRIVIEYEDGSSKGIDFKRLSRECCIELSKLELCPPPSAVPEGIESFILFKWKDGWQEVVGIDKGTVELLRYYTLERTEVVGRMALDVSEDYPSLLLIQRLPDEIESVLILGNNGPKMYCPMEKARKKEGGKVEHVFYDREDLHSAAELKASTDQWVGEVIDSLRAELKSRGLTSKRLLSEDEDRKLPIYREIARSLGIMGMKKIEDVFGFIQFMLASA